MMQSAGLSLAGKTEKLIREYHRQSNIQQTIDALSQAFPGTIQRLGLSSYSSFDLFQCSKPIVNYKNVWKKKSNADLFSLQWRVYVCVCLVDFILH